MSSNSTTAVTGAWLALLVLTAASLFLGEWFGSAAWLPLLVAAIIWLKGGLVARHFIESHRAHPFITWVLRGFIAFTPLALAAIYFFGDRLARWLAL